MSTTKASSSRLRSLEWRAKPRAASSTRCAASPASPAAPFTVCMLPETCRVPSAACWDVAGDLLGRDALLLHRGRDRDRGAVHSGDDLVDLADRRNRAGGRGLDVIDLGGDLVRRRGGLVRKRLDLGRDDGEALAGVAGPGRLDRRVQGEEIGLRSDARDQRDDVADALRRHGEALDDLVGVLHVERVISRIEAASSSVAPATVCTLSEVWSAKAETSSAWRFVSSAVSASERAVVSISSEEAESASDSAPTEVSKRWVISSSLRARRAFASPSSATPSSSRRFWASASLNTCTASAINPTSLDRPRCGISTARSPAASARMGATTEAIPEPMLRISPKAAKAARNKVRTTIVPTLWIAPRTAPSASRLAASAPAVFSATTPSAAASRGSP